MRICVNIQPSAQCLAARMGIKGKGERGTKDYISIQCSLRWDIGTRYWTEMKGALPSFLSPPSLPYRVPGCKDNTQDHSLHPPKPYLTDTGWQAFEERLHQSWKYWPRWWGEGWAHFWHEWATESIQRVLSGAGGWSYKQEDQGLILQNWC